MPARVPDVRQKSNHDCGVACALAVIAALSGDGPEAIEAARPAVERDLRPSKTDGVDPRTLESYFREAGFRVLAGEMDLTDLNQQTRRGRPVVCVVKDHYVIATSRVGGCVQYLDPAWGLRRMTDAAFAAWWEDRDRLGSAYHHFGLIVWRDNG